MRDLGVGIGLLLTLMAGMLLFYAAGAMAANWPEMIQPVERQEIASNRVPLSGRDLYMNNCASCHGVRGQGQPRMGSPLVGSRFVRRTDDLGMLQFLKRGREPGDPDSVMKGFMPKRGGNPGLNDAHMSAIISHMREMDSGITAAR